MSAPCAHARVIDLAEGDAVCTACEAVLPAPLQPSIPQHGICPRCWSTDVSRDLGLCWRCEGESAASLRSEP